MVGNSFQKRGLCIPCRRAVPAHRVENCFQKRGLCILQTPEKGGAPRRARWELLSKKRSLHITNNSCAADSLATTVGNCFQKEVFAYYKQHPCFTSDYYHGWELLSKRGLCILQTTHLGTLQATIGWELLSKRGLCILQTTSR